MDDTDHPPVAVNGMIDGFRVIRALGSQSPARTLLVRRSDGSEAAVLKFTPQNSTEKDALQRVELVTGLGRLSKSDFALVSALVW